jgi:hypothetical protein
VLDKLTVLARLLVRDPVHDISRECKNNEALHAKCGMSNAQQSVSTPCSLVHKSVLHAAYRTPPPPLGHSEVPVAKGLRKLMFLSVCTSVRIMKAVNEGGCCNLYMSMVIIRLDYIYFLLGSSSCYLCGQRWQRIQLFVSAVPGRENSSHC